MDIRSSNNLRRKIFEYKILLDPKLQEAENAITTQQSNIQHLTGSSMPESLSLKGKRDGTES
jgi:hypothetical protein